MAKQKPISEIDDSDLEKRLEQAIRQAESAGAGTTETLRKARETNVEYYMLRKPARFNEGSSSFVSADVYDAVEDTKATLLETFTGNAKPVRFIPDGPQMIRQRQIETKLVDYDIMQGCSGYSIMSDVIHDGLMARNGIVQVFWEEKKEQVPYTVSNLSQDAANAYLAQKADQILDYDVVEDEEAGTVTLHITLEENNSGVRIECVPAEEFGVNSDSTGLKDTAFCYRRRRMTLSEVEALGVPSDTIEDLKETEAYRDSAYFGYAGTYLSTEKQERLTDVGIYTPQDSEDSERLIEVFDCYIRMDTDEGAKTYQCLYSCSRLLLRKVVARHPFLSFTPLRLPHRFWGNDFAGTLIQTQNVNTSVMRFLLDSGMRTTAPRWLVRNGALSNPKELYEARVGGVVNVQGDLSQAVMPLPTPALNPALFSLMEQMDKQKQLRTGSNDLGGAALKDVLSNQNSKDMVQQMATMGQTRTKIIARNFAEFLKDLYERVRILLIENERQTRTLEIAGDWIFVDPASWAGKAEARVSFHIGYGERDQEAAELMQFDQYMASQESLQDIYTPQQRYALITDVLRLKGHYDVERYIIDPAQVPPKQPDQVQMFEASLKDREMKVKEQNALTTSMKANAEVQIKAQSTNAKAQTSAVNGALKQQQQELRVAQFTHQAGMDAAELRLQHEASKVQAIAKPVNTLPNR